MNRVKLVYVCVLAGVVITLFSLMAIGHSKKFGCIPRSHNGTINTDNTAVIRQQIKGWPLRYSYTSGCNVSLALGATEFSAAKHPEGFQPLAFIADVVIWSAFSYLLLAGWQRISKKRLAL